MTKRSKKQREEGRRNLTFFLKSVVDALEQSGFRVEKRTDYHYTIRGFHTASEYYPTTMRLVPHTVNGPAGTDILPPEEVHPNALAAVLQRREITSAY